MGVRRAVEMALDAPKREKEPIYTYGPLIHNPQVLAILKEKGISIIRDMPKGGSGTVIIRAHGVPPQDRKALLFAGFHVLDATCPRVIKVQSIIAKHARQGYASIIIGDIDHPEVIGLLGYAGDQGYVVDSLASLEKLSVFDKAIIVAQTTQNTVDFEEIRKWAARQVPEYRVFNTICDSTENRQSEVKSLASNVDAVIVVGGYDSGNTKRLCEIAVQSGKPCLHIETEADLDADRLGAAGHIGIAAGASTPNWIIRRVCRELESLPVTRGRKLRRYIYILQRYLLLSNLYLALGAGCLSFACAGIQQMRLALLPILMAVFYIQCMHTFNSLLERKADRYNDPDRANFYQENGALLAFLTGVSGIAGLVIAYAMKPLVFVLLLSMIILGIVYNLSLVPYASGPLQALKLWNVPGARTVLVGLAWAIVVSVLPAIYDLGRITPATIFVFIWTFGLVFVRTAFFDIVDMQGSRIVGRETIPILLGEHATMRLLKSILTVMILFFSMASMFGLIPYLGVAVSMCPVFMLIFLYAYEHGSLFPGIRQGFLMESHFVLTGLIALLFMVGSKFF